MVESPEPQDDPWAQGPEQPGERDALMKIIVGRSTGSAGFAATFASEYDIETLRVWAKRIQERDNGTQST